MSVYLYLQIASALRVSILRGDYVPGQQMPPIRALVQRERCNPATVQKVLKVLEKQELIVSRGSKGYFVIESDQKIIELSVDLENEHLIQNAISSLTKGKTVIVIAHRLATIQDADQILVIDNGDVVQKGNHLELINQDGIYKNFISIKESAEGWCIS